MALPSGFNDGNVAQWLNATTRDYFLKGHRNAAFEKSNFLTYLKRTNKMKLVGKEYIWLRTLNDAPSGAVSNAVGFNQLGSGSVYPIQATLYAGKYTAPIEYSGDELRKNTGNVEKLVDIVRLRQELAYDWIDESVSKDVFTGTGVVTVGGKDYPTIVGLSTAVSNTGTYAGISRSTYPNWRSYVDTTTYSNIAQLIDVTSTSYIGRIIMDQYVKLEEPATIIVTNGRIFAIIQQALDNKMFITSNLKAQIGIESIKTFSADIIYDKYCPDGHIYILNSEDIVFGAERDSNFELMQPGFVSMLPTRVDAYVGYVVFSGALIVKTPSLHAKLTNVAKVSS